MLIREIRAFKNSGGIWFCFLVNWRHILPSKFRVIKPDNKILFALAGVVFLAGNFLTAFASTPEAAGFEFFESKIRPLLMDHCYKCHSHDAEKVKGGLLLDTRENL